MLFCVQQIRQLYRSGFRALALSLLLASPLSAQELVEVVVPKHPQADTAVGLLISPEGTTEVYNVQTRPKGASEVQITIPTGQSARGSHRYATGMLLSPDGEASFSAVTRIGAPANSLPICQESLPSSSELVTQSGVLQSLADLRSARVNVMLDKFRLRLSQFDQERLAKLEKGFGLEEPPALDKVENPFKLVERLSRLLVAIKTYEVRNKRAKRTTE